MFYKNSYNKLQIPENCYKLKSFIYISLFVHNTISKAIFSECEDFCTHETFHILKMKKHFEKEPRFENGSSIKIVHRTTYLQILWLVHCDVKDNASEKGSCSSVPSALLWHTLTFSWAQLLLQILQNLQLQFGLWHPPSCIHTVSVDE